jgi:hypothetical protein
MKKAYKPQRIYLALIFLAVLLFICFLLIYLYSKNTVHVIVWKQYSTSEAGLSFDYPKGWNVSEYQITTQSKDQKEIPTASLWICPADAVTAVGNDKGGLSDCVTFYVKSRILNPVNDMNGDDPIIADDFSRYIQDQSDDYSDFRMVKLEWPSKTDGMINLAGFYRSQSNFVGIFQTFCQKGQPIDECVLVFKHILDSIKFVNT